MISEDPMQEPPGRFAWAKFNAYGFVLAILAIMSLADLIHPAGTELARATGDIPPGQPYWTVGFGIAGVLLLIGFLRADRISETVGLVLMTLGIVVQTCVAYSLLGWSEYTLTRIALVLVIGGCTWARVSVLWMRAGLSITIPARNLRRGAGRTR